jgi:hypothetical protein
MAHSRAGSSCHNSIMSPRARTSSWMQRKSSFVGFYTHAECNTHTYTRTTSAGVWITFGRRERFRAVFAGIRLLCSMEMPWFFFSSSRADAGKAGLKLFTFKKYLHNKIRKN